MGFPGISAFRRRWTSGANEHDVSRWWRQAADRTTFWWKFSTLFFSLNNENQTSKAVHVPLVEYSVYIRRVISWWFERMLSMRTPEIIDKVSFSAIWTCVDPHCHRCNLIYTWWAQIYFQRVSVLFFECRRLIKIVFLRALEFKSEKRRRQKYENKKSYRNLNTSFSWWRKFFERFVKSTSQLRSQNDGKWHFGYYRSV